MFVAQKIYPNLGGKSFPDPIRSISACVYNIAAGGLFGFYFSNSKQDECTRNDK